MSAQRPTIALAAPQDSYDETLRFYEDGLGFSRETSTVNCTLVRAADFDIQIIAVSDPLLETRTGVTISIHNLPACLDYLTSEGFLERQIANKYVRDPTGYIEIADPAGNVIALRETGHS